MYYADDLQINANKDFDLKHQEDSDERIAV